jgi:hypothetical protein
MLPLIAITWDEIQESIKDESRVTSAKIIRNYIEFEYRRKEKEVEDEQIKNGLSKNQNYLTIPKETKDFYMMSIARDIQKLGRSNSIQREEMERSIRHSHAMAESHAAVTNSDHGTVQYFNDFRNSSKEIGEGKALESLFSNVRTTGVIVRDATSGQNNYYFPHKQFYEYFIALFCYNAVDQKLAGNKNFGLWAYFEMSNPCHFLIKEPEAQKFFDEMSEERWYSKVFTVKNDKFAKIYAMVLATAISWIRINEKLISSERIIVAIDSLKMPKIPYIVSNLFFPAFLLTSVAMLLTHFTSQVMIFIIMISFLAIVFSGLSIGTRPLVGFMQWFDFVRLKFPNDSTERVNRVLGPVAVSSIRIIDAYSYERRLLAKRRVLER